MKRKLGLSSLLLAGALTGFTAYSGASMPSDSDGAIGETLQQKSQQGLGLEGSGSSNVILGGPEILLGRIEKIVGNGIVVHGDRGQFVKLEVTKDTRIVCSSRSQAKMKSGRQGRIEQEEIPISSATETENKDLARGSGFVVRSSECKFQPGDLVRIEASDIGTMTTITRLASKQEEMGSQIATEKEE